MPRALFIGGSRHACELYVEPIWYTDDSVRMPASHNIPPKRTPVAMRLERNEAPPSPEFSESYTLKHIGTKRGIDMVYVKDGLTEKEAMEIYNEYVGAK